MTFIRPCTPEFPKLNHYAEGWYNEQYTTRNKCYWSYKTQDLCYIVSAAISDAFPTDYICTNRENLQDSWSLLFIINKIKLKHIIEKKKKRIGKFDTDGGKEMSVPEVPAAMFATFQS